MQHRRLVIAMLLAGIPVPGQGGMDVFDAATVKKSDPARRVGFLTSGGPGTGDPERLAMTGFPLRTLLMQAFGVAFNGGPNSTQIDGPAWIDSQRFDIVAKVATGATRQQVDTMLRNLLIERFAMKVHHATRQAAGYELTQSKGGAKLRPTADPDAQPPAAGTALAPARVENSYPVLPPGLRATRWFTVDNGLMHGTGQSQSINDIINGVIATYLRFDGPVVDKTGLIGRYDFRLDLALDGGFRRPNGPPLLPDDPVGPDIFSALDKQLGLKLEKKQVEVDVLVIDSIESAPNEN